MSLKEVYELSLLLTGDDGERNDLERQKLAISAAVKQQEGRVCIYTEYFMLHCLNILYSSLSTK